MANSYVQYTGNGSTTAFSITFDFIDTSHLVCTVAGSNTAYVLSSGNTVATLATAPANGAAVEFRRTTSQTSRLTDYVAGSVLKESDLDTDSKQGFFMGQEAIDDAQNTIQQDASDFQWSANSKRIKNVTNPTSNQDAVTKHYLENTWLSASDKTNLTAVGAKATELGRLGTSDAVSDMNTLGTSAIVADLAILGTSDVVSDMNTLATSDVVSDMNTLATSANVAAMGKLGNDATVTDMGLLGTDAVVADLALLATSDVISDMNSLATSDIISDLNTLAASDIISDMNTLATSDCVSDMNVLATSDVVNDMNTLGTSTNVNNMNTLAGISSNVTSVAGIAANVTTVAGNVAGVTSFAEKYRVGSSDPDSSLNSGDLAYNTNANQLKYYNGSAWNVVANTDTNVAISSNDTSPGQLLSKLTATGSTGVTLTETNNGSNETLNITLAGIPIAKLAASAITINGSAVSLGGSVTIGETKPTVANVSQTIAPSSATTINITGSNFVTVPIVEFIKTDGAITRPNSVSFTNATTLSVNVTLATGAYHVRIENPDGNAGRSTNNIITASAAPTFSTSTGSIGSVAAGASVSIDVDGSSDSTVAFSETTSVLTSNANTPAATMNLTLNSGTGVITGTAPSPSASTTYNFTLRLTDAESQTVDRAFSITIEVGMANSGQFNNEQ
jgi:hypothetical protein